MAFSLSRVVFLSSTLLLLMLSIVMVSLQSLTVTFITRDPFEDGGPFFINFQKQEYPVLEILPQNLISASSKLVLASNVISLIVSLTCVLFAVWTWPNGKQTYVVSPVPTLLYALLFNALLSLIAMAYLVAVHNHSSVFHVDYQNAYHDYDIGIFDLESWACQVIEYKNDFPAAQCTIAKAGRYLDIICCVLTHIVAAVGTWALLGEIDTIDKARKAKEARHIYWIGTWDGDDEIETNRI